jgi:hypothetical protein
MFVDMVECQLLSAKTGNLALGCGVEIHLRTHYVWLTENGLSVNVNRREWGRTLTAFCGEVIFADIYCVLF